MRCSFRRDPHAKFVPSDEKAGKAWGYHATTLEVPRNLYHRIYLCNSTQLSGLHCISLGSYKNLPTMEHACGLELVVSMTETL